MASVSSRRYLSVTFFLLVICNLFYKINAVGFGEPCDTENPCDPSKYLQCGFLSNTCECMNTLNTWYDHQDQICKLLVDVKCDRGEGFQSCVTNAFCPETLNPTCTCDQGFASNSERRCFLPYDAECDVSDTVPGDPDRCDPAGFLKCARVNNGYFCKCLDYENSFYNPNTKKCYLLSSANCNLTNNSMPCLENGHCDIWDRTCKCDEGTPVTPERRCHLMHGSDCDPFKDTCNIMGHVNCHTNLEKCLCTPEPEAIFYPAESGCRLLENAGCSVAEGAQRCINNSECLPSVGSEPRRCKCMYNLSPNKNRECHLTYDDRCDTRDDYCDPAGYLKCSSDNTCSCLNPNSFYDVGARECRYRVGASCRPGQAEQNCGKNAACSLVTETCECNPLYEDAGNGDCLRSFDAPCSQEDPCNGRNRLHCYLGRCQCVSGFINSKMGSSNYDVTCLPGYMQACPHDPELQLPCAPEALLTCIGGFCNCVAPGHHIPQENRCALLVGNECVPLPDNTTNVCVTNAICQTDGFLPGRCVCRFGYTETFYGQCINTANSLLVAMKMPQISILVAFLWRYFLCS
ncbi:platelet endothelial aggregation receptor 1 [Folsomia candida]|uniref:platelet endothelial aggregation receptor 1 n=1 Tax=Folsomia candida TaxID=158441 RepID=UPI0016051C58|nr:platelet endothelial aggregation receptor 1 [Folsomia candida]